MKMRRITVVSRPRRPFLPAPPSLRPRKSGRRPEDPAPPPPRRHLDMWVPNLGRVKDELFPLEEDRAVWINTTAFENHHRIAITWTWLRIHPEFHTLLIDAHELRLPRPEVIGILASLPQIKRVGVRCTEAQRVEVLRHLYAGDRWKLDFVAPGAPLVP